MLASPILFDVGKRCRKWGYPFFQLNQVMRELNMIGIFATQLYIAPIPIYEMS